MIVANDVGKTTAEPGQPDIGFNSEYNALHVFWPNNNPSNELNNDPNNDDETFGEHTFSTARKSQLAKQLISLIANKYSQKQKHNKNLHAQNSA